MATVIALTVKLNGVEKAISNTDELKAAVKATNKELGQVEFASDEYKELDSQLGALKETQKQLRAETREAGRAYVQAADEGKESYRAMNAELVSLRKTFKELTREARESEIGEALLKDIQALDAELKEIDKTIGLNQRNVGDYAQALAGLGGIDLGNLLTGVGAVTAIGTAAINAGIAIGEMTKEVREFRNEVGLLTGETGEDLDNLTARIIAVGDTFEKDYNEVLLSANALSKQFGIDTNEALDLIENGFISGADASGELLDSVREYGTFFEEAGLSAETLINTISTSVKEGIFSDKGIDAIKEAALSLRELPKTAVDSLSKIGIASEDISKAIDEDGIGGAIALVSGKLGEFEKDSQEVGEVVANIFKGAGEDAGVEFILSLNNINQATAELTETESVYQKQQRETLELNKEFAAAQVEVAELFGDSTVAVDNLLLRLQTLGLQGVVFVTNLFGEFRERMQPVFDAVNRVGIALGFVTEEGEKTGRAVNFLNGILETGKFAWEILGIAIGAVIDGIAIFVEGVVDTLEFLGILDEDATKAASSTEDFAKAQAEAAEQMSKTETESKKAQEANKGLGKSYDETAKSAVGYAKDLEKANKATAVAADEFAKGSIAALSKTIRDLKKELDESSLEDSELIIDKLIDAEKELDRAKEIRNNIRKALTAGFDADVINETTTTSLEKLGLKTIEFQDVAKENALNTAQEIADETLRINQERIDAEIAQEEQKSAILKELSNQLFDATGAAISLIDEAGQIRFENEMSELEERYEREIELAAGNTQEQERLREELAQKQAELEEEEFKRQKRIRVATALNSLAEGIVNILSTPSVIPDPFGTAFKIGRVAFLTATTAAQIANINSRQAEEGIIVESNAETSPVGQQTIGLLTGPTHLSNKSGQTDGIPISVFGQRILAENGEFFDFDENGNAIVINKRSATVFNKELNAVKGLSFEGKRNYLSGINSFKGFGIPFQEGGLITPNVIAATSSSRPQSQTTFVSSNLSEDAINLIAERVGKAVERGAMKGTVQGSQDANREVERQQELEERQAI